MFAILGAFHIGGLVHLYDLPSSIKYSDLTSRMGSHALPIEQACIT